ncbi:MAG: DNA topoisomerase [Nitrososphaerota archaeon]
MAAETKRTKVLEAFRALGDRLCSMLEKGEFPRLELKSRSVSNIIYDEALRQFTLGPKRVLLNFGNVKQVRRFTQLVWLAYFSSLLVRQRRTSTLRDVYYSAQAYRLDFADQDESDERIIELETLLGAIREAFNIYPEERSSIFGDLVIEYTTPGYEGRRLNLSSHPDGYMIGPSLSTAELIETSAERVLAVEKGGLFTRFVEEKVHQRYRALLVDLAGQAPRATRYLLRRLNQELGLPVLILTDGDPWGAHIAAVIVSGSANAAHVPEINVPEAKWVGVWATDIRKWRLPSDPFTEQDAKRLQELLQDPRYHGGIWREQLEAFAKLRRKSELEAFSKYGLTAIVDKYLPEKIRLAESL